jgi:hypothetical protein
MRFQRRLIVGLESLMSLLCKLPPCSETKRMKIYVVEEGSDMEKRFREAMQAETSALLDRKPPPFAVPSEGIDG